MEMQAKITAIVVTFNGDKWIKICIESLKKSSYPLSIIVVDNASSDDTVSIVQTFADVNLILNEDNIGFGRANNIGISAALKSGSDYVMLLNQDAYIKQNTITELLNCFQNNPDIGIACPLQFSENGLSLDAIFLKYYLTPYVPDLICDSILNRLKSHYITNSAPAAAWLLSLQCVNDIGGFDPLFFMYCEDDDLCRRARFHGYKISIVPQAHFFHLRGFYDRSPSEPLLRVLRRKTSRIRSSLIGEIKKLEGNLIKHIYHAIADNFLRGISLFISYLDWMNFLACIFASISVIIELPAILRNRAICLKKGTHWLD